LYHLGLVRFLRDAKVLANVTQVTSVSGGSILAAHLVLNWDRYNGSESEFGAAASELLSGSLDPDTTLQNLANLAIGALGDWCAIDLADEEEGLRNVATAHVDPDLVRLASEFRERYPVDPDAPTGAPNVIRTGKSELYEEIPDELLVEAAEDEEHLEMMREIGLVSGMVVPLGARGRVRGAITFVSSSPDNHFDQADLELAEDLARRAGLAVDNAMLFRHEHDAAVTLQRSLLPESLPELPGVQFAARYLPAAPGLEVGGDWYDVTTLGDDRAAMTIGDIAGRGVNAAAVMGHVSGVVRAFVLDGKAAVNLGHGTWHWGPYPIGPHVDLLNLQGRGFATDNQIAHFARDLDVVVVAQL
jgi:hypothetical protein